MALEQEMMNQEPQAPQEQGAELTPEEEEDLDIAVMLAQNIIDDGGISVIDEAVNSSKDPGQVIGQFLMQLVSQMSEQLPREVQFSPRIFLAEGGWLEEISDYLQEQYNIPQKDMDRAEIFVAASANSMAQGQAQQAAQPAPQPGAAPPMPGGAV